jgi:hypothetical protein
MARICSYRVCYLLLMATLLLPGSSLISDDVLARSLPKDGQNELSREAVQHLLSDQQMDDSDAIKLIFQQGVNALPILLTSLQEGKNIERASLALASLGGAKEREIFLGVIAEQKDHEKKKLMSSFLAGALVEPSSEDEWHFLETCLTEYKDESKVFTSFSAALALGINGSPRALHLLQTVVSTNQSSPPDNDTVQEVKEAINWIKQRSAKRESPNPTTTGSDSEQIRQIVLDHVFFAKRERERSSVEDIVFTRDKSRALVSVEIYRGSKDARGYDIVLERNPGMWRIVGAWAIWAA